MRRRVTGTAGFPSRTRSSGSRARAGLTAFGLTSLKGRLAESAAACGAVAVTAGVTVHEALTEQGATNVYPAPAMPVTAWRR